MLQFLKAWAYIEGGHCVSVPKGFKGEIPEKHAKDAVSSGHAKRVKKAAK